MRFEELRERIKLYRILSPKGPYQLFNPAENDVELIGEVWAKREDKSQSDRWGMVRTHVIDRKQFIIRYRRDKDSIQAVGFDGGIFPVFGAPDLDNRRQWTMLLAGRVEIDADGAEVY